MEPGNGYALLTPAEWNELMAMNIDTITDFLNSHFHYDHGSYVALDSDEIYDFFFGDETLIEYYSGGWYLASTKWVQGV